MSIHTIAFFLSFSLSGNFEGKSGASEIFLKLFFISVQVEQPELLLWVSLSKKASFPKQWGSRMNSVHTFKLKTYHVCPLIDQGCLASWLFG